MPSEATFPIREDLTKAISLIGQDKDSARHFFDEVIFKRYFHDASESSEKVTQYFYLLHEMDEFLHGIGNQMIRQMSDTEAIKYFTDELMDIGGVR